MTWVRTRRQATRCLGMMFVALSMGVAFTSTAQQDFSKVEIETIPLVLRLAMWVGAGGNIGVSTGSHGRQRELGKGRRSHHGPRASPGETHERPIHRNTKSDASGCSEKSLARRDF